MIFIVIHNTMIAVIKDIVGKMYILSQINIHERTRYEKKSERLMFLPVPALEETLSIDLN